MNVESTLMEIAAAGVAGLAAHRPRPELNARRSTFFLEITNP
jgi:hypothetical protein